VNGRRFVYRKVAAKKEGKERVGNREGRKGMEGKDVKEGWEAGGRVRGREGAKKGGVGKGE